jgi:phosphoribosylamine--glycine ligase
MKILVIGGGGREHALVWSMRQTSSISLEIYCAPGNGGIGELAQLVHIPVSDLNSLASFAEEKKIDLTFVGPEAPLVDGLVDLFEHRGLPVIGPGRDAARLEGSKIFAKDFMSRWHIPTAKYRVADSYDEARAFLRSGEFGGAGSSVVLKADGLAAGKGVIVAESITAGEQAIEDLMVHHVAGSNAAQRVVIEETLSGPEASVLLFADGLDYVLMPAARDHKRIGENDTGPNTGGMGTFTDASVIDDQTLSRVVKDIVEPTLEGAEREGFPFKGILFLGLMLTAAGPKLLEYNVRFGDPETQSILVRLETDLVSILDAMRTRSLGQTKVKWSEGASACVVVANPGYPGQYETGAVIQGLDAVSRDVQVFHAGTARNDEGSFLATGGRVLGVTSTGANLSQALANCYGSMSQIHWPGMQFRRDIGRTTSVPGASHSD